MALLHYCKPWFLALLLLGACGEKRTPATASAAASPALEPKSFVEALLRTGLVARPHRRWLLFADTTRQSGFQLGHTPEQVRTWLADYEERIQEKRTLDPDSVQTHPATEKELRRPLPLPLKVAVIRIPTTPTSKALVRRQTIQLTHQLRQAGLLTPAEYRQILPLATAGEFYSRHNLLTAVNRLAWAAEGLQRSNALPPALLRLGLLTESQTQQLAHDLRAGVFTDQVDLLSRLPHGRIFNRQDYASAMLPYLEQLHRDVAQLLPGLQFTHFRAQVIPSATAPCSGCLEEDVVVQLRIGNTQYAQRSTWRAGDGPAGSRRSEIESSQFYHIFNQALADQGKPYRLVLVRSEPAQLTTSGRQRFGLWRLTAPQAEALDTLKGSTLRIENDGCFRILPSDTVRAALHAFAGLGFLRHLGPAQRLAAEARLHQARLLDHEEVLRFVPGSVGEYQGYPAYRSWSYARLLTVLSSVSKRQFRPANVRDGCQRADGILSFQLGRHTYRSPLRQASESPDPRLFQLVQRALEEQHLPGKFYRVNSELAHASGMVVSYVFLLPAQERALRQKRLLELADPTLTDAERYAQEEAAARTPDSASRNER